MKELVEFKTDKHGLGILRIKVHGGWMAAVILEKAIHDIQENKFIGSNIDFKSQPVFINDEKHEWILGD